MSEQKEVDLEATECVSCKGQGNSGEPGYTLCAVCQGRGTYGLDMPSKVTRESCTGDTLRHYREEFYDVESVDEYVDARERQLRASIAREAALTEQVDSLKRAIGPSVICDSVHFIAESDIGRCPTCIERNKRLGAEAELAALREGEELMFRATCYACHNTNVHPQSNTSAERLPKDCLSGFTWGHPRKIGGYVGCYASKLRDISEGSHERILADGGAG